MKDEAELLDQVRRGSSDDFGEIVRRYQDRVFAILHRYERDHHRVEDLAQETFIKAWRALAQFDGRAPFEHWLSRIAVRVALDHLRKHARVRREVAFDELGDDTLDWLRSDDDARPLEARQAAELLDLAMRELTPMDRLVITLLELEDRSVKEISKLIGSSGVAVRVRAMRARAKLRRVLSELKETEHE